MSWFLVQGNALLSQVDNQREHETSYERKRRHVDKKRLRELKDEQRWVEDVWNDELAAQPRTSSCSEEYWLDSVIFFSVLLYFHNGINILKSVPVAAFHAYLQGGPQPADILGGGK